MEFNDVEDLLNKINQSVNSQGKGNLTLESPNEYDPDCIDPKYDPTKNQAVVDYSLENLTYQEWQVKLIEKYQKLFDIVQVHLPNLWQSLEFELSIQNILNIKDCTLPFAGIVLGRPSSLKTVGIEMFRKWKNTFYTDNFSAKAMVSHSTAVSRDKLEQIDMLPKIKNKLLLTPELSPQFTKKDDDLIEILGILTRILDGQGYESDTGAHGHRGYHGEYMFTWIGAAVEIPWKVHKYLGNLGAKLYFLRLVGTDKEEDDYLEETNKDDFIFRTKLIQQTLIDYLDWFEKCPEAVKENNFAKIPWNFQKDDSDSKRYIVRLGRLLAHLRGVVQTRETKDPETLAVEYDHTFAIVEEPDRAIRQLINLGRGHALSQGRNYITIQDVPVVINVVLSTASTERVRILNTLLNFGGTLTTRQIIDYLDASPNTAKRTMTELKAIGLVTRDTITSQHGEAMHRIKLDGKFEWFLTDKFKELKQYHPKFDPLKPIQNCIVQEGYEGGIFLDSMYNASPNLMYGQRVLLNSVIPRTG